MNQVQGIETIEFHGLSRVEFTERDPNDFGNSACYGHPLPSCVKPRHPIPWRPIAITETEVPGRHPSRQNDTRLECHVQEKKPRRIARIHRGRIKEYPMRMEC